MDVTIAAKFNSEKQINEPVWFLDFSVLRYRVVSGRQKTFKWT